MNNLSKIKQFSETLEVLTSEDGIELKIPKNLKQRLKFDDNRGDIENSMEGTPK